MARGRNGRTGSPNIHIDMDGMPDDAISAMGTLMEAQEAMSNAEHFARAKGEVYGRIWSDMKGASPRTGKLLYERLLATDARTMGALSDVDLIYNDGYWLSKNKSELVVAAATLRRYGARFTKTKRRMAENASIIVGTVVFVAVLALIVFAIANGLKGQGDASFMTALPLVLGLMVLFSGGGIAFLGLMLLLYLLLAAIPSIFATKLVQDVRTDPREEQDRIDEEALMAETRRLEEKGWDFSEESFKTVLQPFFGIPDNWRPATRTRFTYARKE